MIGLLNCREYSRRLAASEEHAYGFWGHVDMTFHSLVCFICRKYRAQLLTIGNASRDNSLVKMPSPEYLSQLKERIRKYVSTH